MLVLGAKKFLHVMFHVNVTDMPEHGTGLFGIVQFLSLPSTIHPMKFIKNMKNYSKKYPHTIPE